MGVDPLTAAVLRDGTFGAGLGLCLVVFLVIVGEGVLDCVRCTLVVG